jgi:hypothetical protein
MTLQQSGGTAKPVVTDPAIQDFAQRLGAWAQTLTERQQAMVIDLLAKAGGDVHGLDAADTISSERSQVSSSEHSPLELRDFSNAIAGMFATPMPSQS